TWGCPHNPHYVRMMEGRVRAQAETGIDGSYVDWTHMAGGTCYCDYTRRAFTDYLATHLPDSVAQAKYGTSDYADISLPTRRGDAFWMEWLTFRGYSVAEFHRRLRTVARKYNPDFMISGNVFGGFGYGPIAYDAAGNMEMLGQVDDFIYSEIQEYLDSAPRKDQDGTKITNSPALKFLAAAAHNKPVIVYATEITPPIFPDPSEKALSAMARINIAEAVTNHAIFREKRQTPPGATEMYAFLAANESYLLNMKLASNIAILASLNQYLADEQSYAFSLSRVLADHGVGHVMIVEDDLLDDDLSKNHIVILPHIPLLSKAKQRALVEYVRGGGQLLILGKSGIKDEYDQALKEPPLAGMLERTTFPPQSVSRSFGDGRVIYLPVTIPEGGFLIPARKKGDVTTFGPAMMDVFADIPEGYTRNRMDPQLRQILEGCARRIMGALNDQTSRVLRGSRYVELTTMLSNNQDRLLVHLVNYDVTVDGTVTPATDLRIQVLLPEGRRIKSVIYSGTLGEMKPLTFRTQDVPTGQMVLIMPDTLETYGLAVIEMTID
ncbi:MAG: beta-galactosidase trimerization domain-containing protein, partial [Fidelibacterota bacterium]